jgi:hypothetical protein
MLMIVLVNTTENRHKKRIVGFSLKGFSRKNHKFNRGHTVNTRREKPWRRRVVGTGTENRGVESRQGVSRVARWFVFKTKIQIWVHFRGSCKGRWYIL